MKQRYFISRDEKTNELTIEEYAVVAGNPKTYEIRALTPDDFTLLCIETYEGKEIKKAISKGKEAVVSTLRTDNLYPISIYADLIADSVMEIYGKKDNFCKELLFDDLDLFESLQDV
jgi:phosphoribosylamine-glycine ligase